MQAYNETQPFVEGSSYLTQSNFYIKQAATYAQCGKTREARNSLEHAYTVFPTHPEEDPAFLYADFGPSSFFLWEGLTLLELARHGLAQPKEAWDAFAQVEGAHPKLPLVETTERGRIEIINHQAGTAVVMGDLDCFCTYLTKGIEGAKQLGSAMRHKEATYFYWQARKQWPHETRVKELAELFIPPGSEREVLA
jgi:hypothetical protein